MTTSDQGCKNIGIVPYLANVQVRLVAAAPPGVGCGVRSVVTCAGVCNLDLHGTLLILAQACAVHFLARRVRDDSGLALHLQALPAK